LDSKIVLKGLAKCRIAARFFIKNPYCLLQTKMVFQILRVGEEKELATVI